MKFAMNSTVISGTPRTNSMKITLAMRTIGRRDRRPSASRTPPGSENTMPTVETSRLTKTPPHRSVEIFGRPRLSMPLSSTKAITG